MRRPVGVTAAERAALVATAGLCVRSILVDAASELSTEGWMAGLCPLAGVAAGGVCGTFTGSEDGAALLLLELVCGGWPPLAGIVGGGSPFGNEAAVVATAAKEDPAPIKLGTDEGFTGPLLLLLLLLLLLCCCIDVCCGEGGG